MGLEYTIKNQPPLLDFRACIGFFAYPGNHTDVSMAASDYLKKHFPSITLRVIFTPGFKFELNGNSPRA